MFIFVAVLFAYHPNLSNFPSDNLDLPTESRADSPHLHLHVISDQVVVLKILARDSAMETAGGPRMEKRSNLSVPISRFMVSESYRVPLKYKLII